MTSLPGSIGLVAFLATLSAAAVPDGLAAHADPQPVAIRTRLAAGNTASGVRLFNLEALQRFYGGRGYRPAWRDGDRLAPAVDALSIALHAADREGLRPADYHTAAIDALLARLRAARPAAALPARGTADGDGDDLDLLLSDAFFLYARHLTAGRANPRSVDPGWNIAGRERDLAFLLAAALDHRHLAETLHGLPPQSPDYRLLRDALAAERASAAAGGWPLVPPGTSLREGDRNPRVAALRRRLAATGELPAHGDADQEYFDPLLAEAVRRFQAKHGLDPDAIVGSRTAAALNVPAAVRVGQIEVNLERMRWLPREFGPRRLLVNVPDFRLELTEAGAPPLAMRVIAGRQARRTPFFAGVITNVILNPAWTVPETIAVEDKLPQILEDRAFFKDQGFRVFARDGARWREIAPDDVDWTRRSKTNFPYRLRQDPGPKNALGRIKFQVPNRHDIYLHDTPAHELFARSQRPFSSGCIRVEHALELAARLLAADPAWPRARIEAAIAAGATVSIPLAEPLPVALLYLTAWVDRDGALQLREDVYGNDGAVLAALALPPSAR